ncbi:carotenoid biosynthesis protein [Dokdonia sinensis]|nr:carotenoid biosynthesis protein [Dokdonia sinensis]
MQKLDAKWLSIGTLWLFHISAIIGITAGYFEFFVTKTPLNLIIAIALLVLNYKINTLKTSLLLLTFFSAGMFVEWVGVHNDFLFGPYAYGDNLGWKLDGVPYLIGVNWAILVFITGAMANTFKINQWLKVFLGAFLMVFLDFMIEVAAPIFDFWAFDGGVAPLQNYIAWFAIASVLHFIFQRMCVKGDTFFSVHLYVCQLVFFTYFAVYYTL